MIRKNPAGGRTKAWSSAYGFAVANAVVFAALSAFMSAVGFHSVGASNVVALLFALGAAVSAFRLVQAGEGLVAVAFFVMGAGLTFGFGTFYATVAPPDFATNLLFPEAQRAEALAKINLINSVSVVVVLLCAWPLTRFRGKAVTAGAQIMRVLDDLSRYMAPLVIASCIVVGIELATFPMAENLILRNVISVLARVPLATLVVAFAYWSRQSLFVRAGALFVAAALFALGILTTAKTSALLPLLAIIGGLWLNPQTRRISYAALILSAIGYFTLIAPLSHQARRNLAYDNGAAGLKAAVGNISDSAKRLNDADDGASAILRRFSSAPYQSYLISQYDTGSPGQSMHDFWVALVPRVLWPSKPNVTRFGGELYGQINRTAEVSSALGPTYSGEAYWNYGWLGLLVASAAIGVEIGWLTQRWLDLAAGASRPGILVMAIPVAFFGFWVETWFAATYVGGFVTVFLLINGIDLAANVLGRSTMGAGPRRIAAGRSKIAGPWSGSRPTRTVPVQERTLRKSRS